MKTAIGESGDSENNFRAPDLLCPTSGEACPVRVALKEQYFGKVDPMLSGDRESHEDLAHALANHDELLKKMGLLGCVGIDEIGECGLDIAREPIVDLRRRSEFEIMAELSRALGRSVPARQNRDL
jgi:hypothetical protein